MSVNGATSWLIFFFWSFLWSSSSSSWEKCSPKKRNSSPPPLPIFTLCRNQAASTSPIVYDSGTQVSDEGAHPKHTNDTEEDDRDQEITAVLTTTTFPTTVGPFCPTCQIFHPQERGLIDKIAISKRFKWGTRAWSARQPGYSISRLITWILNLTIEKKGEKKKKKVKEKKRRGRMDLPNGHILYFYFLLFHFVFQTWVTQSNYWITCGVSTL